MSGELKILFITAASIGFFHTLFGPDHYLPFIVMGRARNWSLVKTSIITFLCGLGHVLSSVLLGAIGIALGMAVMKLEGLEAARGNLAAWALIGFGFAYFIWGIRQAIRNRPHKHMHIHDSFDMHVHDHAHTKEHAHVHTKEGKKSITPWILFTIFVLGPCEPLIPILMYPAAKNSMIGLIGVTLTFSAITIMTMLAIVVATSLGVKLIPMGKIERYTHALAGATICLSGLAIQFLGL
ncbi:MAG: sulfite exporter TauE/SafE family protein [Candidatus Omnitrophica bacterium]|nr:sulfite exporter TauE/SafE family protein [Candidatus Omnitrophota bacterium]